MSATIETITGGTRTPTAVAGTGLVGDPMLHAVAASFIAENLADKNAEPMTLLTADSQMLEHFNHLTAYDQFRHRSHINVISGFEHWRRSPQALGNDLGTTVKNTGSKTLVVVDHADGAAERWAWANTVSQVERCVILTSAPTGVEGWRLFSHAPSKVPEILKVTLANSDSTIARTLTVKTTRFKDAAGEAGERGFVTDETEKASFTWAAGGKAPDMEAWRDAVARAQAEAEQTAARHWLESIRPDPAVIPPALLAAAPWLADSHRTGK